MATKDDIIKYVQHTPENTNPSVLGGLLSDLQEGKSIQSDWNQNDETAADYVKNRPFYTGKPVEIVLVEESTVLFEDSGSDFYVGQLKTAFEAIPGEIYKVSWDGADYESACATADGIPLPFIGNLSIIGKGSNTGEPFLMIIDMGGIIVGTLSTSASHTFSISRMVVPIVKIDDKYLAISETIDLSSPSDWTEEQKQNLYEKFISGKVLLAKNIPNVDGLLTITYVYYDKLLSSFVINAIGDNYMCIFNGSSWYRFELTGGNVQKLIDDTLSSINSWKLYSNFGSEVSAGDLLSVYVAFDKTTNKACISTTTKSRSSTSTTKKSTIVTNGDSEIVLSSSTPGSTKKFKITVDDTGALKATEVTA